MIFDPKTPRNITIETANKLNRLAEKLNINGVGVFVNEEINELKEIESINELNSFIKALENSFIIDENLSINKAVEILWTFRNIDLSNVQKFTTPVDYLTLNDGRQVLVLNDTIHNFLKKNSVIDS